MRTMLIASAAALGLALSASPAAAQYYNYNYSPYSYGYSPPLERLFNPELRLQLRLFQSVLFLLVPRNELRLFDLCTSLCL